MASERSSFVVIGGASLDIKGRLRRPLIQGTSNAASIQISIGGVGRNIAENLARLGTSVSLLAAVCADDFGRAVVEHTAAAGVDMSAVLMTCNQRSASYIAILEPDGSYLAGLDDSAAARAMTPEYVRAHAELLEQSRMVIVDANLARPAAEVVFEICAAAQVPLMLDPVAYGLAERYRDHVGRFFLVTANELEAEALTGVAVHDIVTARTAAQKLVAAGVDTALITLAAAGVVYASAEEVGHVPATPVNIVDPTGAGAALAATVIYCLTNGIPLAEAIRLGHIAATLTLRSSETVVPELNLELLYEQLEL